MHDSFHPANQLQLLLSLKSLLPLLTHSTQQFVSPSLWVLFAEEDEPPLKFLQSCLPLAGFSEMSEKPPSSLAVAQKPSHHPGGCVGIFFHLFDWNKRLAKKKLFSRKLLPPARTKPSKRFGGDEKMPKSPLHPMPDHSHLGFPNKNKSDKRGSAGSHHKNEIRSPGLVARLMGLESMPAVCPDKPNKPSRATSVLDMRDETHCRGYNGEDMILETRHGQIEPRPQKIQRTGSLERRAVASLGADAFQLKAVLSRPRKHHHPKLSSPIKSPRLSTSRTASRTSRLIDAATRILEPGLQAANKAKSSLPYSTSLLYPPEDKMVTQGMTAPSAEPPMRTSHKMSRNQSSTGQTSCRNCATLIDAAVSSSLEERGSSYPSFPSNTVNAPCQMLEDTFPRPYPRTAETSCSLFGDVMSQRSQAHPVSFPGLNENRRHCENGLDGCRMPAHQDGQALRESIKPEKDEHRPQNPVNMETLPPRAKLFKNENKRSSSASAVNAVSHQVKDFVALNRNLSRYTRPRVASKMEGSHLESQKRSCNGRDGSLRERKNASVDGQTQYGGFVSSSHGLDRRKPRNDVDVANEMLTACPTNRAVTESRSVGQRTASRREGASDGAAHFPFNSALDERAGRNGKIKDQNGGSATVISLQMKAISDEAKSLQDKVPWTEAGLAVLLEQKLKELTSQEDELRTERAEPKRSTAMILLELISALTAEHGTCQDSRLDNSDAASQTGEERLVSWAQHFDHRSPGSVLEASFSNDSCVSSSFDDNSGIYQHGDSMDYPNAETRVVESDEDILDSAASLKEGSTSSESVTNLVDQISRMLSDINKHDLQLPGEKFIHVKEVMRRVEALFGKPAQVGSWDGILMPFVQDEVETLAQAMELDIGSLLGCEQTKQQLRRFLFDCAIEFIESKYGRWHGMGYQAWRRLALSIKCMSLIQEAGRAVRMWGNSAGMVCDELIEWEMSDSAGEWRKSESEGFEAGSEIGGEILGGLVEEVVVELWERESVRMCY